MHNHTLSHDILGMNLFATMLNIEHLFFYTAAVHSAIDCGGHVYTINLEYRPANPKFTSQ